MLFLGRWDEFDGCFKIKFWSPFSESWLGQTVVIFLLYAIKTIACLQRQYTKYTLLYVVKKEREGGQKSTILKRHSLVVYAQPLCGWLICF